MKNQRTPSFAPKSFNGFRLRCAQCLEKLRIPTLSGAILLLKETQNEDNMIGVLSNYWEQIRDFLKEEESEISKVEVDSIMYEALVDFLYEYANPMNHAPGRGAKYNYDEVCQKLRRELIR